MNKIKTIIWKIPCNVLATIPWLIGKTVPDYPVKCKQIFHNENRMTVCVCVREREREKERDRQTDRERQREREISLINS